jgi:hypothetical protein
MTLQWAEHFICAAHCSPLGVLHGHTWRVRAYWSKIIDAEDRKAQLVAWCGKRCHTRLEGMEASAEGLAKSVGEDLSAARVDVWREAEGLGATWSAK